MAYTKYSLTPANNNAAPPDGAPEGMLPSAVNDTMRDMMAQIRDCGDGIRGGTYTMTAPVITGGSINGATIGGTTAGAGNFTNLSYTGTLTGGTGVVNLGSGQFYKDASGNIGIGISNPAQKFIVAQGTKATTASAISSGGFQTTDSSPLGVYFRQKTDATAGNRWTGIQSYDNGVGEANLVLQDLGGNLLVGTTSAFSSNAKVQFVQSVTNWWPLGIRAESRGLLVSLSGTEGYGAYFERNSGDLCGYIYVNNNNTVSYATSSDYRLKENIAPMTGALDVVQQLKPVTYNWKADGSNGQGFIAHELQEVVPDCVTGEKDAVDAEGKPVYQGIDTSFLVATLTSAIQEQQVMINELKAKVAALEAA